MIVSSVDQGLIVWSPGRNQMKVFLTVKEIPPEELQEKKRKRVHSRQGTRR